MKHIFDDQDKNKYEALDKAETLAAIQQIIEQGEIPSELLNGVAITLRNPIDDEDYKIAFCTQAKYSELEAGGELEVNCYYFITDDSSYDDLNTTLEDIQSTLDWVVEKINTGLKNNLTSVSCAFDFTNWNNYTGGYSSGSEIYPLSLENSSSYGNNQVNILPAGSNTSIALAKVEYVSGDSGYIEYQLNSIGSGSYITFSAMNVSNGYVRGVASSTGTLKTTTFKLTVQDIYGFEFSQEFTINYKA